MAVGWLHFVEGEKNLLAGCVAVNSKIVVQPEKQIFAEDADRFFTETVVWCHSAGTAGGAPCADE